MAEKSLDRDGIQQRLDQWLDVEFSFLRTEELADDLATLVPQAQWFVLDWTRRVAAINVQVGFEFARRARRALTVLGPEMIEAWCKHAMESYDREGLRAALEVIRNLDGYRELGRLRERGALFDEVVPVLLPYLQGLSGRRLKLETADEAWTDGEVLYLPEVIAQFASKEQNFQLAKALLTQLWAQTRFGTLNVEVAPHLSRFAEPERARQLFVMLETIRLDAWIRRELPGQYRRMEALRQLAGDPERPDWLQPARLQLERPEASIESSLAWLERLYPDAELFSLCYQTSIRPEAAWAARQQRLLRDQARVRETLRLLAEEIAEGDLPLPERFELQAQADAELQSLPRFELLLGERPLLMPEQLREHLQSIHLDLGEIPEEYLVPAGPGEYDPALLGDAALDPDDVWGGTYHEEGAFLYDEWDHSRQHYRRRWCVLREHEIQPAVTDFYDQTMRRHGGLVRSLRRTFEILRGEDQMLRRQPDGEDLDVDAYVEAWSDARCGLEMSDRLFTRMSRDERSIATLFMVDMSGSTRGWINEVEREALILLVEALEVLGDQYAIYGFSGWARKRCEAYRIKTFEEPMNDAVRGRICAVEAKDYTRMGAPIRHFTRLLEGVEARTKLLVTLSDGKPDDYDHYYRGEYGIEDTRQALFEARTKGIHAFCITIDREGRDYLPHMYGAANYRVLDEVTQLPLKVTDIYRRLTS